MNVQTVLLTTDFSETSLTAVESARVLADKFDAKLLVAYVEDDRYFMVPIDHLPGGAAEFRQHQRERSVALLRDFVDQHFAGRPGVELVVPQGVPHAEIVRLAEERGVDMIVMATHGRGFISHAIVGSTTERVVRRAPCAVHVVPRRMSADT